MRGDSDDRWFSGEKENCSEWIPGNMEDEDEVVAGVLSSFQDILRCLPVPERKKHFLELVISQVSA